MMIEVLYSNIESVLKVNGSLCVSFGVHEGIVRYSLHFRHRLFTVYNQGGKSVVCHWDDTFEKVNGLLSRWKWLLPKML